MNTETKQPTCADLVAQSAANTIETIRLMLDPQTDDVTLGDDGSLDTVLMIDGEQCERHEDASNYRDDDTGELDAEEFISDSMDDIVETQRERFYEYGLSFDYVEPSNDNPEPYFRYQISWGGPSTEFRFFANRRGDDYDWITYKVEYWYLDWFDGAKTHVSGEVVELLWAQFNDTGSVQHAFDGV